MDLDTQDKKEVSFSSPWFVEDAASCNQSKREGPPVLNSKPHLIISKHTLFTPRLLQPSGGCFYILGLSFSLYICVYWAYRIFCGSGINVTLWYFICLLDLQNVYRIRGLVMIQRKLGRKLRVTKKKTHFISMFENVLIVF